MQLRARRVAPIVAVFVCWAAVGRAQTIDPRPDLEPAGALPAETTRPESTLRLDKPPLPFWTPRRIVLVAGLGAAATAGAVGWSRDRELQRRRRAIQLLPAGSPEEFQRQLADARVLVKARDFWLTAAFGIGGAALCYVVTTSPDIRPLPGNHTWVVQISPSAITIMRAF